MDLLGLTVAIRLWARRSREEADCVCGRNAFSGLDAWWCWGALVRRVLIGDMPTCRAGPCSPVRGGPAGHICDTEAWLQGDAPVARMLLRDVGVGLPALMPSGPSLVRPGMMLADFTQGDAAHARVRARAEQDGLASGELAGALSRRNRGSLMAGVPCRAALALPSPFRRARGADRSRGLTVDPCGNGISRVACCRRVPRHGPCLGRSATCRSGVGFAALRCGAAEAVRRRRGRGHAAEDVLHLPRRHCCAGAGPGGGGPAGLGRLRRPGSWLSSVFRGHRGPDPSAICDRREVWRQQRWSRDLAVAWGETAELSPQARAVAAVWEWHGPQIVMEAHGGFLAFKGHGPSENTWMPHAGGMGRRRGRHARPSRGGTDRDRALIGLSLVSPCYDRRSCSCTCAGVAGAAWSVAAGLLRMVPRHLVVRSVRKRGRRSLAARGTQAARAPGQPSSAWSLWLPSSGVSEFRLVRPRCPT